MNRRLLLAAGIVGAGAAACVKTDVYDAALKDVLALSAAL